LVGYWLPSEANPSFSAMQLVSSFVSRACFQVELLRAYRFYLFMLCIQKPEGFSTET
jgi:hypothetical protein